MTTQTKTEYIIISRQTGDEIMIETSLEKAAAMASIAGREKVSVTERVIRTETEEREVAL